MWGSSSRQAWSTTTTSPARSVSNQSSGLVRTEKVGRVRTCTIVSQKFVGFTGQREPAGEQPFQRPGPLGRRFVARVALPGIFGDQLMQPVPLLSHDVETERFHQVDVRELVNQLPRPRGRYVEQRLCDPLRPVGRGEQAQS